MNSILQIIHSFSELYLQWGQTMKVDISSILFKIDIFRSDSYFKIIHQMSMSLQMFIAAIIRTYGTADNCLFATANYSTKSDFPVCDILARN